MLAGVACVVFNDVTSAEAEQGNVVDVAVTSAGRGDDDVTPADTGHCDVDNVASASTRRGKVEGVALVGTERGDVDDVALVGTERGNFDDVTIAKGEVPELCSPCKSSMTSGQAAGAHRNG